MNLIKKLFTTTCAMLALSQASAGDPVWTFTPKTPTTVTVFANSTATVVYEITNQSTHLHTLIMQPIPGVTPTSNCSNLSSGQSCTLKLTINGNAIGGSFSGGPVLCELGNPLECYRPGQQLQVSFNNQPSGTTFTVTASGDTHVTATPSSQTVNANAQGTVTLNPDSGYDVAIGATNTCGGSLVGNTYTTSPVTANCAVSFTSTIKKFTVTATGDEHVTATPANQTVNFNGQGTVTLNPDPGYDVAIGATNTCGGSLVGNTYTTSSVTANCAVSFISTIKKFTVTATGDEHVTATPPNQTVNFNSQGTVTLTPAPGYIASIGATNTCGGSLAAGVYTTSNVTADCTVTFVSAPAQQFTVTAFGDEAVSATPFSQNVTEGDKGTVTLNVSSGYLARITNDTCNGSLVNTTYTTGPVTNDCTVAFGITPIYPAAEGPSDVLATPHDGKVDLGWIAPTNTGTGTVTGYIVTYGPTSGTSYSTFGCEVNNGLGCTVYGLSNGTAYTFAVKTKTSFSQATITGPASFSSSVTPTNGLTTRPSTLALSSLPSRSTRYITLFNNSSSPVTITQTPAEGDFVPALPSGTTLPLAITSCKQGTVLAANSGFCEVAIAPGTNVSTNAGAQPCTEGVAPQTSNLAIQTSAGPVTAKVVVLGYGCQYQGGYLYSIDDSSFPTGSVSGKVVTVIDQATFGELNAVAWSPNFALDSIWGIDDKSTPLVPSPVQVPGEATLLDGQLNCDAVNNGACATNNIKLFYGAGTNYAAGLCQQALSNTGTVCSGGQDCYADWYLPAVCDLGPFGSSIFYPLPAGSHSCSAGSTNIAEQILSVSGMSPGVYWSSTEGSDDPLNTAWRQAYSGPGSQDTDGKDILYGVRCTRTLTP